MQVVTQIGGCEPSKERLMKMQRKGVNDALLFFLCSRVETHVKALLSLNRLGAGARQAAGQQKETLSSRPRLAPMVDRGRLRCRASPEMHVLAKTKRSRL